MTDRDIQFRLVSTPLGTMALVARGRRLVGVLLPDGNRARLERELGRRWPEATEAPRLLPGLARAVADYFAGRSASLPAKIDLGGCTPFQRRVLKACRRVPAGKVVTYGDLARRIGSPRAARAVGGTMARNPVPLVIPCHRVVAADGALGGFSAPGGCDMKRRLLDHERRCYGA